MEMSMPIVPSWDAEMDPITIAWATNSLSHQLIDNPAFRKFIVWMQKNPTRTLPDRRTLRKNILHSSTSVRNEVRTHLRSSFTTIAIDSWTNVRNECVNNVCGIANGNAFYLTSVVNKLSQKNTAEWLFDRIAPYIQALIDNHHIQIVAVVTDNGSNMMLLGSMLEKRFGILHLPCAAHLLQLMVKKVLGNDVFKDAISATLNLMQLFKNNKVYRSRLLKQQFAERPNCTPYRLVKPNDTRWSSMYYCCRRLLSLEMVVRKVMLNEDGALTDEHWTTLKHLVKLLKPFQVATDMLQRDDATLIDCYRAIQMINNHVGCFAADMKTKHHAAASSVAKEWQSIFSHYADKAKEWTKVVSATLDVACCNADEVKGTVLEKRFGPVARAKGYELFSSFGAKIIKRYTIIPSAASMEIPQIETMIKKEWADFEIRRGICANFGNEMLEVIRTRQPIINAYTKYFRTHPFMTTTARIFLSMNVTEAAVERTFSAQDQVHSKKRNRLMDDVVTAEMVLKFNVGVLRQMEQIQANGTCHKRKKNYDELPYSSELDCDAELANVPPEYVNDIGGAMDDDGEEVDLQSTETITQTTKEDWERLEEDEEEVDIATIKEHLLSVEE